jgi:hypothetical protein
LTGAVGTPAPGRLALPGALLLCAALVAIQQFVSFADASLFGQALHNALHVPLFAMLTLLLALILGMPRWWVLLLAAFALAVATEVLQFVTGGTPSVSDLVLDLIGIVPVVTGVTLTRRLRRQRAAHMRAVHMRVLTLWAGLALLLAIATLAMPARVLLAYQQRDTAFPELLTPAVWSWSPLTASTSRVRVIAAPAAWTVRAGAPVLEVTLAPGRYPGIQLSETVPDWSAFDALVVEAFLPEGPPILLTAAVGYQGTDGTSAYVRRELRPGAQRLRYPMSGLLRADRVNPRISHLILHTDSGAAGRSLLIGPVVLEVGGEEAGD